MRKPDVQLTGAFCCALCGMDLRRHKLPVKHKCLPGDRGITATRSKIEAALRSVADQVYVHGDPEGSDVAKVHDEIIARTLAELEQP